MTSDDHRFKTVRQHVGHVLQIMNSPRQSCNMLDVRLNQEHSDLTTADTSVGWGKVKGMLHIWPLFELQASSEMNITNS